MGSQIVRSILWHNYVITLQAHRDASIKKFFLHALGFCDRASWANCEERERENQQDATIRCLLSTMSQHVSGIIMPIFRRKNTVCYCMWCAALGLLDVVGSGCGALRCRMRALSYNAAPHNHYQPHPAEPAQHTACSNTRYLFSWRWA